MTGQGSGVATSARRMELRGEPATCSRAIKVGISALAAAVLGAPAMGSGQELSPPVTLEQAQPEIPTNRFGWPLEGWVKVRYTVLADGTTAEVRVLEAMPASLQTRSAVSAAQRWKFEPAKLDGEAIEWHSNESLIVFDHEDVPLEATPMFLQSYMEIVELIENGDYARAQRQNNALQTRALRLAEIGLVQAQAAVIHVALSNPHDGYEAVLRATDPRVRVLPDEALGDALRYRFGLAVELGRYADALETLDRLAAIEPLPKDDPLRAHADAIRQALAGEAAIVAKGRVNREPWSYAPTRRTFTFADVEGTVRNIELECDRRKVVLDYSADAEWSIPESWGDCTMFVNARRNTTFSIIEFP